MLLLFGFGYWFCLCLGSGTRFRSRLLDLAVVCLTLVIVLLFEATDDSLAFWIEADDVDFFENAEATMACWFVTSGRTIGARSNLCQVFCSCFAGSVALVPFCMGLESKRGSVGSTCKTRTDRLLTRMSCSWVAVSGDCSAHEDLDRASRVVVDESALLPKEFPGSRVCQENAVVLTKTRQASIMDSSGCRKPPNSFSGDRCWVQ